MAMLSDRCVEHHGLRLSLPQTRQANTGDRLNVDFDKSSSYTVWNSIEGGDIRIPSLPATVGISNVPSWPPPCCCRRSHSLRKDGIGAEKPDTNQSRVCQSDVFKLSIDLFDNVSLLRLLLLMLLFDGSLSHAEYGLLIAGLHLHYPLAPKKELSRLLVHNRISSAHFAQLENIAHSKKQPFERLYGYGRTPQWLTSVWLFRLLSATHFGEAAYLLHPMFEGFRTQSPNEFIRVLGICSLLVQRSSNVSRALVVAVAGEGTGGRPSSYSVPSQGRVPGGHNNSPRGNRKRKPTRSGNSGNNSSSDDKERKGRPEVRNNKKPKPSPVRRWACPYWKHDSIDHKDCVCHHQRAPRDIKQHLLRSHRRPIYCPTCFSVFETRHDCDGHVNDRSCVSTGRSPFEHLISEDVARKIEAIFQNSSRRNEREQWYDMWDLIFPQAYRPDSPYMDDETLISHVGRRTIPLIVDDMLRAGILHSSNLEAARRIFSDRLHYSHPIARLDASSRSTSFQGPSREHTSPTRLSTTNSPQDTRSIRMDPREIRVDTLLPRQHPYFQPNVQSPSPNSRVMDSTHNHLLTGIVNNFSEPPQIQPSGTSGLEQSESGYGSLYNAPDQHTLQQWPSTNPQDNVISTQFQTINIPPEPLSVTTPVFWSPDAVEPGFSSVLPADLLGNNHSIPFFPGSNQMDDRLALENNLSQSGIPTSHRNDLVHDSSYHGPHSSSNNLADDDEDDDDEDLTHS